MISLSASAPVHDIPEQPSPPACELRDISGSMKRKNSLKQRLDFQSNAFLAGCPDLGPGLQVDGCAQAVRLWDLQFRVSDKEKSSLMGEKIITMKLSNNAIK